MGTSIDDLWKVGRGEIKYADFLTKIQGQPKRKQPKKSTPQVPEELVKPFLQECITDCTLGVVQLCLAQCCKPQSASFESLMN